VLRRGGFTTLAASNGLEALSLIRANAPHINLLVSDIYMPFMDGRTLATLVRDEFPGVAIILISGYTAEAVTQDIVTICKPFLPATILSAAVNAIANARQTPAAHAAAIPFTAMAAKGG
jgi:two-component system, cell cycle sensor histidine kinase and response regulator CckA